jgi:hypothetical protein
MASVLIVSAMISATLWAEEKVGGQVGEMSMSADDVDLFKPDDFSPYAGRRFPTRPLWGDTHLHTSSRTTKSAHASTSSIICSA